MELKLKKKRDFGENLRERCAGIGKAEEMKCEKNRECSGAECREVHFGSLYSNSSSLSK